MRLGCPELYPVTNLTFVPSGTMTGTTTEVGVVPLLVAPEALDKAGVTETGERGGHAERCSVLPPQNVS